MVFDGPLRSGILQKKIPEISIKMFTQTVRELERDGLIQRTVYPEVPPRVDYTLTPEGQSLDSILKSLDTWGRERFSS
jgi:DNA-binding HxlR family transcriptional regulator